MNFILFLFSSITVLPFSNQSSFTSSRSIDRVHEYYTVGIMLRIMRVLNLSRANAQRLAVTMTVSMHHDLVFAVSIERIVCPRVNRAPWRVW